MNIVTTNYVFDTIQAAHADVVMSNQRITAKTSAAGQQIICRYLDIVPGGIINQVKVAEVSQVDTITFTGTTNSITYGIEIVQYLGAALGYKFFYFTLTTPATGVISATTIATQFRTAINANTQIKVTASGAGTLILTADAGYPFFKTRVTNAGLGAALVNTTAGVAARGVAANLTAAGAVYNTSGVAFTGSAYTQWQLKFTQPTTPGNTLQTEQLQVVNFWVNEGSANYAALQAYLLELSAALPAGGVTYADPEIEALI